MSTTPDRRRRAIVPVLGALAVLALAVAGLLVVRAQQDGDDRAVDEGSSQPSGPGSGTAAAPGPGPPPTLPGQPDDPYTWTAVAAGGGGFATGVATGPTGEVFARTDVGGAYRWDDLASSWRQVIVAPGVPDARRADYGVLSLAVAPSDGDVVYVATGDTLGRARGRVLRSDDGGRTWATGDQRFAIDGNGDGRRGGERLSVDPADPDTVLLGTQTQGLWRSVDGARTWERLEGLPSGSAGEADARVDVPVVATTAPGPTTGGPSVVVAAVGGVGIVRSDDGLRSWEVVHPIAEGYPRHASAGPDGVVVVAVPGARPSLVAVDGRTGEVTDVTPPGGTEVATVAVDPRDPDRLVAGANGIRDGELWRSDDGGATWRSLDVAIEADGRWPEAAGVDRYLAAGALAFDPTRPGTLWLAEGVGMWRTDDLDDGEVTWSFSSSGMELVVANDVAKPAGAPLLTAQWDRPLLRHPSGEWAGLPLTDRFMAGWDLAVAPGDPSVVAVVAADHRPCCDDADASGLSDDAGATWRPFPSLSSGAHPPGLRYGNIAISSGSTDDLVWVPSEGALPHRSSDGGRTWEPARYPGSEPHQAHYLDRHVLAADPVAAGTFYVLDADGVLRSDDGGASWELTEGTDLVPRYARRWNATLVAVPGRAGELLLSSGPLEDAEMGLLRSLDGGDSWVELPGIEAVGTFGLGPPTAEAPAELFATGRVGDREALWRTPDMGASWCLVADHPGGLEQSITVVAGDPEVPGRVHVGFAGTGFVVGEPKAGEPGTSEPTSDQLTSGQLSSGQPTSDQRGDDCR